MAKTRRSKAEEGLREHQGPPEPRCEMHTDRKQSQETGDRTRVGSGGAGTGPHPTAACKSQQSGKWEQVNQQGVAYSGGSGQ